MIIGSSLISPAVFAREEPAKSSIVKRDTQSQILACRSLSDIPGILPALARNLKTMDSRKLFQTYEKTRRHTVALMKSGESHPKYHDGLEFIADAMRKAPSRDEKMALIFLSLPRLFERAVVMPWTESESEHDMLRNEGQFLIFLDSQGFQPISKALVEKWYKDNGVPPTKSEQMEFLEFFSKSYQSASSGSP